MAAHPVTFFDRSATEPAHLAAAAAASTGSGGGGAATRCLANLGNTCYLNAAIQALRHSPAFVRFFTEDTAWKPYEHPDRAESHALLTETQKLVTALAEPIPHGRSELIVPQRFVKAFVAYGRDHSDAIGFGQQADVAEALQVLIDGLHMQLARPVTITLTGNLNDRSPEIIQNIDSLNSWSRFWSKEYSDLLNVVYGQTLTRLTCSRCGTVSSSYEPWNMLKVGVPGVEDGPAPTLAECIADSFAEEHLDDYVCDSATCCGTRGAAVKSHAISRFPPVLLLVIKRFTNTGRKIRARIPYDEEAVDFAPFRAWPRIQGADKTRYRVSAVIEHLGSFHGGHYIMRGRVASSSPSPSPTSRWFIFNDSRVTESSIGGAAGPDTYVHVLDCL